MNTEIIRTQMLRFRLESLKKFLGINLVDTLLEWTPDNQQLINKAKLTDMILAIHGINILAVPEFRKCLLVTFTEEIILSFAPLLSGADKRITDPAVLVNKIVAVAWRKNNVSLKFLQILKIDEDIFENNSVKEISHETISSAEKFYELLDYQFVINSTFPLKKWGRTLINQYKSVIKYIKVPSFLV